MSVRPASLASVIDLHCHVLPGIDDGPVDLAGSVAMAELASQDGVGTLVATPHLREDYPRVRPEELADRVDEVNQALRRYDLDVVVLRGAEVALSETLSRTDQELREATLGGNGRDLLIETPHGMLPSTFESLLSQLQERGFRVTLAHPELNPDLQRCPQRLACLVEAGVLSQITARSLRRPRGSRSRALASLAVKRGWTHALGSDAHSAQWRPPNLGRELVGARRRLPAQSEELAWLAHHAPEAILAGAELPPRPDPAPASLAVRIRSGLRAR